MVLFYFIVYILWTNDDDLLPRVNALQTQCYRQYCFSCLSQVDGDIPTRVKRNAHELILDFIRSRPPLKPVSLLTLVIPVHSSYMQEGIYRSAFFSGYPRDVLKNQAVSYLSNTE